MRDADYSTWHKYSGDHPADSQGVNSAQIHSSCMECRVEETGDTYSNMEVVIIWRYREIQWAIGKLASSNLIRDPPFGELEWIFVPFHR